MPSETELMFMLNAYVREHGTPAQKRAFRTATTNPRNIASSHYYKRERAGPRSVTLFENTDKWLRELPKGTISATVEVAIARYRLWPILLEIINDSLEVNK